ncbi:MAG: CopG family transcriptional regulator [Candidatus Bathyarchaeota archaeon]|nr:CopG family transcriptional regulator [Candidatus Bathyarchaeota archaeon]MDH5686840.1 CopG family transcriptional regulator [Candidatus Bathyarchaeota archaeon]
MSDEYVAVKIPRTLYDTILKRVEESQGEFKDAQEYIEFVLNEIVKEEDETETPYTPEEEEMVKKRLKKLGYL